MNANNVVLVTGGSRGIGSSIVRKFASLNYDVIFIYLSSESSSNSLKEELEKKYNVTITPIKADLAYEEDINNMFNIIDSKYNHIDVLVNNAAISKDSLVSDKTKEDFMNILDVNLIAPFLIMQRIKKYMEKGSIINISSTNSIDTYYPYSMDYDASKAGLNSLTKNFACLYAPNIRVNAVAPGWVNTDMNRDMDSSLIEDETKKILLNRFANPDEIASVVAFLASSDASYINGEIIRVDGGSHE